MKDPTKVPGSKYFVLRLPQRTVWWGGAALVVLGVLFWLVTGVIQNHQEQIKAESISPDGMHRVVATEKIHYLQAGSYSFVMLYLRKNSHENKDDVWALQERCMIDNDSMVRSDYSIVWKLDNQNNTKGVKVFGCVGTVPYRGEILVDRNYP